MTEAPNGSVSRFIPVISDCEPLDPYKTIHDMTQILSCISCITVSKNHFSAASAVNNKTVFHVRHDPQGKNRCRIPVFISGTTADIIFLRCQQYPMQYKNRPARCLDPGFVFCLPTVFCLSTSIRSTFGSAVSQTYRTSESDLPWLFLFQPAGPSDIRSHPQYLLPSIF